MIFLKQAHALANFRLVARIEIHQNLLRSIRRYTTFFNICAEGILDLETFSWHSCDEKEAWNLATKQDYPAEEFWRIPNPFPRNPIPALQRKHPRSKPLKLLEDAVWIFHIPESFISFASTIPGSPQERRRDMPDTQRKKTETLWKHIWQDPLCLHSKADLTEVFFDPRHAAIFQGLWVWSLGITWEFVVAKHTPCTLQSFMTPWSKHSIGVKSCKSERHLPSHPSRTKFPNGPISTRKKKN